MLRLYDTGTGHVNEVVPARPGVARVACTGGLRPLVVGDLIRRLLVHHRLHAIGIWPEPSGDLPVDPADLGVRPPELTDGPADVHVGPAVGRCSLASFDGIDPLAVRLALLRTHYRTDITIGRDDLAEAEAELDGWRRCVARWADSPGRPGSDAHVAEAVAALDADLDTPAALAVLPRLAEDDAVPPGAKFETAIMLDMILGLDLVRLIGRL